MKCRLCHPQVMYVSCPACEAPSVLSDLSDRYVHLDGSDSTECVKEIERALRVASQYLRNRSEFRDRGCGSIGVCGAHAVPQLPDRRLVVPLAEGDRVIHDQFGVGRVVSVKGIGACAEASVDFGDTQPKRLHLGYAPLSRGPGVTWDDLLGSRQE